ncbi:TetR/AcrR family transcriptional regulator C-terminal domain-containing protein [Streptomyces yatensis]|uniref:Transcriptional regulator TetR C-terminal Proteobacteria type domain-containing protein n=1 Tax=Streptomyces yatensis TaxID=155177 RepID=A0ABN2IUZ5_9ACTN|nr:TetR/AcrR family transcriptional regulator C-terminal domain-containing protein [Streptomyces yatensis]
MEELVALAESGSTSLVGLMVSDSWNHVRETFARFTARECKPKDTLTELDGARHRLIAAQKAGDENAVRDISAEWQSYLHLLLCTNPPSLRSSVPCSNSWELGRMQFQLGKLPYFTSVQHYLESEHEAGDADPPDSESAANQFLGMIANYVLWPRMLLTDWNPAASDIRYAVEQAVETMLARYTSDRPA